MALTDRLKHAWSAFFGNDDSGAPTTYTNYGPSYSVRSDQRRLRLTNERTILASVLTRISMDVAGINIRHVRLDENDAFLNVIKSDLDYCLNIKANIDQEGRAFRQDMALSLFDQGTIAIVPIETTLNPLTSGGYDIKNLRVGEIISWYPQHVRVSVYNEQKGRREEIVVPKSIVAIVENPLHSVMNEPNSTLQRLIRKLSILDSIDEAAGSGKLDVIIQLPYVVKSETRKEQARERRESLEQQLKGSTYGVGYIDATEKITQLNRPAENNLLTQVEYLTNMLYGQLGITEDVFKGTADEATMLNYYSRTIESVVTAITEAIHATFLTKTAQTQGQAIRYFRDPFKLVPIKDLAEMADKFTRNEILTSNEFRGIIGYRPSTDPKADQLVNSNVNQPSGPEGEQLALPAGEADTSEEDAIMEETLSALEAKANEIITVAGG